MAGAVTFVCMGAAIGSQVFSGAAADRMSGARAFRLASLAQALCWAVLAGLLVTGASTSWIAVMILAAIAMAFSSLCFPSQESLVKRLAPAEQVGQAAAVSPGRQASAELLGGPVGGLLMGVAGWVAIVGQTGLQLMSV